MIFWNPFTGSVDWIHKDTQRSWYMAWVRVWQRQLIQNRGGGLELCSCCRVLVKLERSLGFPPQHCIKPVVAFHAYNPNTQEVEAEQKDPRFKIIPDSVLSLRSAWSTWDHIESQRSLTGWKKRPGASLILCSHLWNGHKLWLPWKHCHNHLHWLLINSEAQGTILQKELPLPLSL